MRSVEPAGAEAPSVQALVGSTRCSCGKALGPKDGRTCATCRKRAWRWANPELASRHDTERERSKGYARQRARRLSLAVVADGTVTATAKARKFAERDECCVWCGIWINTDLPPTDRWSLTWAHMTALARGGAHSMENLEPAHRACNAKQGVRSRDEHVEELVGWAA